MSSFRSIPRRVPTLLALALVAPILAGSAQASPASGSASHDAAEHDSWDGPGRDGLPMFDADRFEARLDDRADRIADLLKLTDDQRATFDRLRADALEGARPKMERMRQMGDDLRQLLDSDAPDATQVGAKMIEIHQLREELKATKDGVEAELVKILTPEQRFALDALKEARHDADERGPHGPGPGFDQRFGDRRGHP